MPAAYVGDTNSLSWNFISFPRKPSYSASFLHWIFSLSYPYLTTLYIFNSIVSWSPKPSPLRNPWIHRGCTPVAQDFYIILTLKWPVYILSPLPPHVEKAMAPHSSTLAWKNPMDGGAWWATVHGVAKSRTQLSDFTFTFHFHALEKEMTTHSSVLAWRIPGTAEPPGLPSMGSHRVGHDWSDLAAITSWSCLLDNLHCILSSHHKDHHWGFRCWNSKHE